MKLAILGTKTYIRCGRGQCWHILSRTLLRIIRTFNRIKRDIMFQVVSYIYTHMILTISKSHSSDLAKEAITTVVIPINIRL